jgi:predicted TIM-barrel fold metal-dependent hydrolase
MKIDYWAIDADTHYYEDEAAFTRHLPTGMAERAVQWVTIAGARRMLVAGRLYNFVPNDSFDVVTKPGALDNWFRGVNTERKPMMDYFNDMQPCDPAFRDREKRLQLMDRQSIAQTLMFPTMACGIESSLAADAAALTATLTAFNRWLHEQWGYSYAERIFAAPAISLADVGWAVQEVNEALKKDARTLYLSPGPVFINGCWTSIGDKIFDPFWALVNESGITVSFHQSLTVYQHQANNWVSADGAGGLAFGESPMRGYLHDRAAAGAIEDTIAALICHGVFTRHPGVRVLSIENGAEWVPLLLRRLKKAYGQMPWLFPEPPIDTFRRHVWISPYQEDDFAQLKALIGVENILFGSDFPHPEGLAEPVGYAALLTGFDDTEVQAVMRKNAANLLDRTPR